MSVEGLMSRPLTIIRTSSGETLDDYGTPVEETEEIAVSGELQQIRREEPAGAGELSVTEWNLFLPAGTEIDTSDRVRDEVDGLTYHMAGDPWHVRNARTGQASHLQATVRRAQ
jgi:hypothetical protein